MHLLTALACSVGLAPLLSRVLFCGCWLCAECGTFDSVRTDAKLPETLLARHQRRRRDRRHGQLHKRWGRSRRDFASGIARARSAMSPVDCFSLLAAWCLLLLGDQQSFLLHSPGHIPTSLASACCSAGGSKAARDAPSRSGSTSIVKTRPSTVASAARTSASLSKRSDATAALRVESV